jgi:hypothetical protein
MRALRAGLTVAEVPVTFIERARGTSKMGSAIVREAFWRVTQWGITARLHRPRGRKPLGVAPPPPASANTAVR